MFQWLTAFLMLRQAHWLVNRSLFGYNLAIVDVIILGSNDSFDDVKEQINVTLGMEKAIDLVYEKINLIEDALGTGSTLEEVAFKMALPPKPLII